ncbi:TIR domain-containing adapter molecule 1 [Anarrhichthys ocellatus]|uniref:TIR domain-containing adapter molecule 1 n=1 Tax=Anarrhichthys ocellatus TaxID=433405 RepID=UPI0012ECBF86|nr:TIR domain-containing adapter molecule 1-like [Anarrhichthys ocellatus]
MSHGGQEDRGTGLKDVFDILVKALPLQLLSLTFQLGESPEENIVHALCLIILQKEARALDKLQRLKNNHLATQLVEKWQMSEGKLEDFAVRCGHFQELAGESLALLARIFKVLSERRLCDPCLRNLAYKRALSSDDQKASSCEKLEHGHLTEEAKVVCGPQFAEWVCSSNDLKSGPYRDPLSSLDEGNATLRVTLPQDQSERAHSLPSPLQVASSMPSYPTHLEISIAPTASFQDDRVAPETSAESKLKTEPALVVSECEAKNALSQSLASQPRPSQPPLSGAKQHSKMDEALAAEGSKSYSLIAQNKTLNQTTRPNFALPTATNIVRPKMPAPYEMQDSKDVEEEEEAIFYSFVILHAPEDDDVAESMRERVKEVIGSDGATFSGDFAIPGKSTLRCVEDAIDNSAFTLLLFTRNFNTRMLEVETDSALINSINKRHKYNTVIPLLPRENCMHRDSLPLVLQTINPLEENRSFDRKIKKLFCRATIEKQRKIWNADQLVKREIERQQRLKNLNQSQQQLIKECATAHLLEEEMISLARKLHLGPFVPPEQDNSEGRVHRQQQQNIHIENANYIIIGNESHMTVGGGADKDDSVEEQ